MRSKKQPRKRPDPNEPDARRIQEDAIDMMLEDIYVVKTRSRPGVRADVEGNMLYLYSMSEEELRRVEKVLMTPGYRICLTKLKRPSTEMIKRLIWERGLQNFLTGGV